MSLYRLLLRRPAAANFLFAAVSHHPLLAPHRNFAFSSAEEAAAERRRRKRQLRIEPPLHALHRNERPPPPRRDPNAPRLPDSTSSLVGPRLSLHNRVQSLIRAGDLAAASAVARRSVASSTRPTVFTCNALVAAAHRAGRHEDAVDLFEFFFNRSNIVPNVVSYNNLINTYCDQGCVDTALGVYRLIMETAPFSPSAVTYRHLTKGLVDAGRIGEAVDLLREMLSKGHGADSFVYNNLISGFLNLGNLEKANELFDELKERCLVYDGVVNATFMDWFFNKDRVKEAMESYKSLLDRQFKMIPATCNALLEVLIKHGKKEEAWQLFDQMLDNHTPPNFQAVNSDTFNIMVNLCFELGQVSEALDTFRKAGTKHGAKPFAMDVAGYNNVIARLCEVGMLSEAELLFGELSSKSLTPDVATFRTLIDASLKVEKIDDALRFFHKMVDAGLRVVDSFGCVVFDLLIENGKAVECSQILTKMAGRDPKPDASCYDVVIRGLCKEAELDASLGLLEQMMRYGIGVTPSLREFVTEEFDKVGRGGEVERVLTVDKQRSVPNHSASRNNRPFPPSPSQRPQVEGTRQVGNEVSPSWRPHFANRNDMPPQWQGTNVAGNGEALQWGSPQMGRQAAPFSPGNHYTARNDVTVPSGFSNIAGNGNVPTPPPGPSQMERRAMPTLPGPRYMARNDVTVPSASSNMDVNAVPPPRGPQMERQAMSTRQGSYYASPEQSRPSYTYGNAAPPQWRPQNMDGNAPAQWGPSGMGRQTMTSPSENYHVDGNIAYPRRGPLGMERQAMTSQPGSYHMNGNAAPAQWGYSGMGGQPMPSSPGLNRMDENVSPPQPGSPLIERQTMGSPHRMQHMDGNIASTPWGYSQGERQTMSSPRGPRHIDGNIAPPQWGPQMDRQRVPTQPGPPCKPSNIEPSYHMEQEGSQPSFPYIAQRGVA